VPAGSAAAFKRRYASAPAEAAGSVRKARHRVQKPQYLVYRVKRGQTLSTIAKRYGTTVTAIRRRNKLRANRIRVGQSLMIPTT
jgi:membrane-bound lytic murein transglycosylase D